MRIIAALACVFIAAPASAQRLGTRVEREGVSERFFAGAEVATSSSRSSTAVPRSW